MVLHLLLRLSGGGNRCLILRSTCAWLAERLYVCDQRVQLFVTYQTLKGRHNWIETLHNLGSRIQDRFPQIIVVNLDGASVFQHHRLAKCVLQIRPAPLYVRAMAGGASERTE